MKRLKQAVLLNLWLTVLCGLLYPAAVTGLARTLFRAKADGSLVSAEGRIVGSSLIGQGFSGPRWFHGRPSAAGAGYDALSSGGSNLGPTSKALVERVDASVAAERKAAGRADAVPGDLVTASGSGLDPDITPESAYWQAPSVAKARGLAVEKALALVEKSIEGRTWGFLGEPRVNVLKLNLALDALR